MVSLQATPPTPLQIELINLEGFFGFVLSWGYYKLRLTHLWEVYFPFLIKDAGVSNSHTVKDNFFFFSLQKLVLEWNPCSVVLTFDS